MSESPALSARTKRMEVLESATFCRPCKGGLSVNYERMRISNFDGNKKWDPVGMAEVFFFLN